MARAVAALVSVSLLSLAPSASAQYDYDQRFGQVVEVTLDSLLQMPETYADKAVKTRGELTMLPGSTTLTYALRGTFGGYLIVTPMREFEFEWETEARRSMGREIEVTGIFQIGSNPSTGGQIPYLTIWRFLGPPEEPDKKARSEQVTLEDLVSKPGKLDGKIVTVRGQFRGQNLFGDLPSASRRRSSDWVIKDDLFAVWVSGKKPKGAGWSFDAGMKRDTGKWLQVTGRVTTQKGVVTIEATSLSLSSAPSPTAQAQAPPPPPPPPRAKKPPVVVFSLPLDGERDVEPGTVFQVQFSKDLDEASLKDRVVLRYAGRPQPGDRALDAVRISYDGGLRTLQVDPGDLLRPGRVVELLLLPGISDIDGQTLQPRPGISAGQATDVLRFQIAAPGLFTGGAR